MRELTWDDFAGAEGSAYVLEVEGQRFDFKLDRVEQLPPSIRAAGSFRLEFLGPREPVIGQAIHTLTGSDGEPLEIFIVPVAREAGGIRYEAIFS